MKKTALLLILVMIISLIPALNVSAAGEYELKGLYQGATVVIQHEPTKTVTVEKATDASDDISKVVFTFNGVETTATTAPFEYTMEFENIGGQTLKYDVYKASNSSDIPDVGETLTFNVVAGKKNAASISTDFESVAAADVAGILSSNHTSTMTFSVATPTYTKGGPATGNAARISASERTTQLQLRKAEGENVHKVHYYSFDVGMTDAYTNDVWITGDGYNKTTHRDKLFENKEFSITGKNEQYVKISLDIIVDANAKLATLIKDDAEWKRVPLTNSSAGSSTWGLVLEYDNKARAVYIDNFKYDAYDVATPQSFTATSIPGGDNKPVAVTLPEVRITGADYLAGQNIADFVTLSQKPNDGSVGYTPTSIDYDVTIVGADIVFTFNESLAIGTTYKIDIAALRDSYYVPYNTYSFTFRTLNENENPLPEISLITPQANQRFYPNEGDTVTLSASAVDTLGGTVEYVEFYADGVLIEGSRVLNSAAVEDVYTYVWALDGSIDREEPVAITAKAVDDENGESETMPVNITLRSKSEPEVTITSPATGTLFCSNLAGKDIEVKPVLEFATADADGTIAEIKVYVDGVAEEEIIDPAATTYTLATDLVGAGTHSITVEVYDDHGLNAMDTIEVAVEDRGKSGYLINEDYTSEDLVAKWSGNADKSFTEGTGIVAKAVASEQADGSFTYTAGKLGRTLVTNFTDKDFAADIKVSFNDTASKRVIGLDYKEPDSKTVKTIELATFAENGKITFGGTQVGTMTYNANQTYNISIIADEKNDRVYALVDGTEVGTPAAIIGVNPVITITQEGAGSTEIMSCGASMLGTAVIPQVIANGKTFTVDFPAGTDLATLENNVSMLDSTGKAMKLTYADGVFTVNSALKTTETYTIIVLPDARDINGNGYCGTKMASFTAPASTTVVASVPVPVVTPTTNAEDSTKLDYDFGLNVTFDRTPEETVYLVCAVYNGSKMTHKSYTPISAGGTFTQDFDGVDANAQIEAFVVDANLNALNEELIKIK